MKTRDDILLEQAYNLVKVKLLLQQEGYSADEIESLIREGKFGDAFKKVGRYAAPLVAAASMMGGDARANDANDAVSKFKKDASQSIAQIAQNEFRATGATQQQEESRINDVIKNAFGDKISADSKSALMKVVQLHNIKGPNVDKLINKTAEKLKNDGKDVTSHIDVYNIANMVASGFAR